MATKLRSLVVERLPIKLIMPHQGTEKRVPGGGSPSVPFRKVDDAYRRSLSKQVLAIKNALFPKTAQSLVAPVRVKLLNKAAAKSHRPERIFSPETCPIVGAGGLGELFIKATPFGLQKLTELIETNTSERVVKELSSIEAIEAITPTFRRRGQAVDDILRRSPRSAKGFMTKVRLFNFGGGDDDQPVLVTDFERICGERNILMSTAGYSPGSYTYGVECKTVEDLNALTRFIGVRSVASMPVVHTVRAKMYNASSMPKLLTRSEVAGDIPVVVVVDSGVSDSVAELES